MALTTDGIAAYTGTRILGTGELNYRVGQPVCILRNEYT